MLIYGKSDTWVCYGGLYSGGLYEIKRWTCCIRPSCGLKATLAAAQSVFYRELETYTLSDIITEKSTLEMLLSQTRER